ncbi:MAG: HAMP domain-containing protein [Rhodospirillaceae bacterium]|nr:HAMP domain-containing protein [Rhodospirillaceae bacterium]MBT6084157.1 HAMP domain-containing protein [Rhodospirillaceae bacterium]MBT6609749.1 HAMP domain-containing protein [Rhodospirillaceae bacterium]MBT6884462.1 HAMP domain-containing protein [Rhodospirillaceae bacterium]
MGETGTKGGDGNPPRPRPARSRLMSPITRRILAINILALGFLGAGILYLDEYKENLIDAELTALGTQAEMFAVALSEGAVAQTASGHYRVSEISNQMVRRLVQTTSSRARLFGTDGRLIADSRRLVGPGGMVSIEELPPPEDPEGPLGRALEFFERIVNKVTGAPRYPAYAENSRQHARDYSEVIAALSGEYVKVVRSAGRDDLLLGVTVPVQRYKQVLGALLVTKDSSGIDAALYETRRDILKVFAVALALTVMLSIYLAGTIARPLKLLAAAAERVRADHSRQHKIPDMAGRDDEIGELAATLKDMTEALWQRMDAIDRFAADVAHEIKNPLTSLRSAVETAARLKDGDQQKKLMAIIQEDVVRLDRLISDISDASRLDAELSRAESEPTDLAGMLATLADIHNTTASDDVNIGVERVDGGGELLINGIEGRLAQVFRNLITNAITFSPAGGAITLTISREQNMVRIDVDDEGPGIPPGNEERIFTRFYTERAETEKFGTHSGLGLSISQQIINAHGGDISATNRLDANGDALGARFTVRLPVA